MKDPKGESDRWLEQAVLDLDAAHKSTQGYWWIACFQAQQAAEKALKAYLYASEERAVLGNSVAELAHKAEIYDPAFENVHQPARRLDRFYIPTRYPNGLPGGVPAHAYDEDDAASALEMAGVVMSFVKERLKDG